MVRNAVLGEFEQLVLLAALKLGDDAYAPEIGRLLENRANREMSRGTLYAALERLEGRNFLVWEVDEPTESRGGQRRRKFSVTAAGTRALAESRRILLDLWDGVEDLLVEEGA